MHIQNNIDDLNCLEEKQAANNGKKAIAMLKGRKVAKKKKLSKGDKLIVKLNELTQELKKVDSPEGLQKMAYKLENFTDKVSDYMQLPNAPIKKIISIKNRLEAFNALAMRKNDQIMKKIQHELGHIEIKDPSNIDPRVANVIQYIRDVNARLAQGEQVDIEPFKQQAMLEIHELGRNLNADEEAALTQELKVMMENIAKLVQRI